MTLSEEFEKETGLEYYEYLEEIGNLVPIEYVKWLEAKINYTRCSTQLKDNEIEFSEFIREFCIKTETFKWLYKGVTYTDREIDQVYKNYLKTLNL